MHYGRQMDPITILGIVAGTLTTASFLPQVIKAYRSKHTKDVSLFMFILLFVGLCLWLAYGFIKADLPIILANIISIVFVSAMLALKAKHG